MLILAVASSKHAVRRRVLRNAQAMPDATFGVVLYAGRASDWAAETEAAKEMNRSLLVREGIAPPFTDGGEGCFVPQLHLQLQVRLPGRTPRVLCL